MIREKYINTATMMRVSIMRNNTTTRIISSSIIDVFSSPDGSENYQNSFEIPVSPKDLLTERSINTISHLPSKKYLSSLSLMLRNPGNRRVPAKLTALRIERPLPDY